MTIKEAWKYIQTDGAVITETMYNASYDIDFINSDGEIDETQFDIPGERTKNETVAELDRLFTDFCKENSFNRRNVVCITYIGRMK